MSRHLPRAGRALAPAAVAAAVALAASALAGCGGGDPAIVGLYMTTSHVRNDTQCTGNDTPVDGPAYFRITPQKFLGTTVYNREDCDTTDEASCTAGGGLVDQTGTGSVTTSSGDASSCTLGYITWDAALDGDQLTFTTTSYTDSGAIDPCTTDEADRRGDTMPCASYEVLVGSRVKQ